MNKPELIKTFEPDFIHPVQLLSDAQRRRKEIDEEVAAYLAKGGKITECQSCVMAEAEYLRNEFTGANDAAVRTKQRETGANVNKKASMNSKFNPTSFPHVFKSDADKTKFVVIIKNYISKQFKNATAAANHRDWKLAGEKS